MIAYVQKHKHLYVGKTIKEIHTMGWHYGYPDDEEDNCLKLDEPVVICFEEGLRLEVWFFNTSHAKLNTNSLAMTERSYQGCPWQNVSDRLSHIANHVVVDMVVIKRSDGFYDSLGFGERPEGGDYFGELAFMMDSGHSLIFGAAYEYMFVLDRPTDEFLKNPR